MSENNDQREPMIENLDELSLPRRKQIIFGKVITLRRVDEIGLMRWAELEQIEQEMNQVRQRRTDPSITNEAAMALLVEEIDLRLKLISEYISDGLEGNKEEFRNMSDIQFKKITDLFTQPPLPLPEELAALEEAETRRQARIAAGEVDSMEETSQDLTDSTEIKTG